MVTALNVKTPIQIGQFLDQHRHLFEVPEAYYGCEPNSYHVEAARRWLECPSNLKILWMAAWPYTQFTGNQTLPLLYKLMYDYSVTWVSERSHMPNTKREVDLHEKFNMPVYSLETKHAAGEFDVIGTSLGYPPFYFNIVKQLQWSGIPVRWRDRVSMADKYPLILAGGSTYGNPLHWSPMVDIVFVGEAEDEPDNPGVAAVFTDIETAKQDGRLYTADGREDLLHELARKYHFLYIPRFVELQHDPVTKYVTGFQFKYDDIPRKIKKRVVWDMNRVPCIDRAMIPLHDPTMGPGEIEVARGCPAHCTFCAVTFRYAPYRERDVDYMVKNLRESVRYSGSNVAFPCSFEFGSYSRKKTLVRALLEGVTDYVDTQSMRVDSIAKDPDFTRVAGEAGMKQLVLGVEGNSQRLREFVNKGINEDQIMQACMNAFQSGFNKIKLYMIADLPYEDQSDTDEIVRLCEKIVNLRDSMGVSAQVRCSWTPLLVEAQTPLQWFACTLDDRKLTGVYAGLKKLGVGFSLGKKTEQNYSYYTQLFHLCDDLAADAILTVCEQSGEPYLGSVDRRTRDMLTQELAARGVSFDHYFCAKPGEKVNSFIFPWDFVDVRTAKKFLHRLYKQSVERIVKGRSDKWKEGFVDTQGACYHGCDGCAGCDAKKYSPETMRQLWDFDDRGVQLEGVKIIDQTTVLQKMRLRVVVDQNFRYIPNVTWQFIMRRAAFLADLPIAKRTIRFASDSIKWKNWTNGQDYCEFGLTRKVALDHEQVDEICLRMNANLEPHGIKITDAIVLEPIDSDIASLAEYNLYEIPVDIPIPTVTKVIEEYHAAVWWEVVMKEDQYRAGVVRERVNLKSFVRDLWAVREGHQAKLRILVRGKASPFDALRSLFKMREIDAVQHIATRLDVFKEIAEHHADFFACECVDCGDVIPLDLFDRAFDQNYCPVCKDEHAGNLLVRKASSAESGSQVPAQVTC